MASDDENTGEITNKMLLDHMQAQKNELQQQIKRMQDKTDAGLLHLDHRMTANHNDVTTRLHQVQTVLGNIDARLDDLELAFTAKRLNRIEAHLHLPPLPELAN